MLTTNQQFRQVLERMIGEDVSTETEWLANGAALDFPDYRFRAGKIQGLRRALALCDEAESEINKRNG